MLSTLPISTPNSLPSRPKTPTSRALCSPRPCRTNSPASATTDRLRDSAMPVGVLETLPLLEAFRIADRGLSPTWTLGTDDRNLQHSIAGGWTANTHKRGMRGFSPLPPRQTFLAQSVLRAAWVAGWRERHSLVRKPGQLDGPSWPAMPLFGATPRH